MGTQYSCKNEGRRAALRAAPHLGINGIDYLQVGPDQLTLQVFFLFPLPGPQGGVPAGRPALGPANVVIAGGVRVRRIKVRKVEIVKISDDPLEQGRVLGI